MATLADLTSRLAKVRSKERSFVFIQGICRVLVALVLVVVAFFLIDWIADLPYGARLLTAAIGLAVVGYVAYRSLYLELKKIQDDDEMALRVEARNPDLRGRLISTLQLVRTKSSGAYAGSTELLAALEEETVRMSDPLDFSQIVSTVMLKRLLIAALIVIVIKAALLVEFPDHFKAMADRLVHPESQYPTKTRIKGEPRVPQFVARGDDIPVEVTLDTGTSTMSPREGKAFFINTKSGTNVPVELIKEGNVYKGAMSKALEDVDVIVELGDVRTKRVPVKVHARPEVDTSRSNEGVKYTLPAYTEETAPPAQKFGALSSLQGSLAEIQFTATKALRSAVIERSDGRKFEMKALPAPAQTDPNKPKEPEGMTWSVGGFPIDKSGTFHVSLVDTNGLTNGQPSLEYPIDARPDLAPMIKLVKPTHDNTVTPTARPVFEYNARDDFGLRTVWIAYKIMRESDPVIARPDGTSEKAIPPTQKIEFPLDKDNGKPRRELLHSKITLPLEKLNVKVTDQVVVWLECDDFCDTNDEAPRKTRDGELEAAKPGEKVYPRTQDVKLTVISRADKEAELRAELQRLYQLVERSVKGQEELKTRVLEIKELLDKMKAEK